MVPGEAWAHLHIRKHNYNNNLGLNASPVNPHIFHRHVG